MKNIKAQFQLLDNFVREYNIKLNGKINEGNEIEINCNLGFGMQDIREEENRNLGQVQLVYDITLIKEKEEIGKIKLLIEGLFEGNKELGKEKFEEMLKYNGASTLSQIARAYIISNTSLGGMPTINVPMINFMDFFKNASEND